MVMPSWIQMVCSGMLVYMPLCAYSASWKMVPEKSNLAFTAVQNHAPVTGTFSHFTGDIAFDPDQLATSHVRVVVNMDSVTAGYGEIASTLKTPDWFNSNAFPEAVFESKAFVHLQDNRYEAQGMLTIRGQAVPLTLHITLAEYQPDAAHVTGDTTLNRTAFGVGQGEWKNTDVVEDNVKVHFDIHAVPATAK